MVKTKTEKKGGFLITAFIESFQNTYLRNCNLIFLRDKISHCHHFHIGQKKAGPTDPAHQEKNTFKKTGV
jgi:hypothetical protein